MGERPILFSAPMIRAILDGRKTQTRRILKPQPFSNGIVYSQGLGDIVCHDDYLPPSAMLLRAGSKRHPYNATQDEWERLCPYGQPGDALWVKETFSTFPGNGQVWYRADRPDESLPANWSHWGSPLYMQRRWSRITLEITSVRVERLNSISEDAARAEGCDGDCPIGYLPAWQKGPSRYHFASFWDSIYGKGAWAANPWVFAIAFKRVLP